jgi:enterochelin esterase-like enzyme
LRRWLEAGLRALAALLALVVPALPASAGLTIHADFPSKLVKPRTVAVWVPDGLQPGERLPVIYMHDGQNLFDPGTAFGGTEWGVDEAVGKRAIVVGIWNIGDLRWQEYMPQRMFDRLPGSVRAKANTPPTSDAYVAFLTDELKPFIDATYPTIPGRRTTFIMGSSMGGLISLYAQALRPDVFSRAAGLSTHWPLSLGGDVTPNQVAVAVAGALRALPGRGPFYVDSGDQTLDATYAPFTSAVLPVLESLEFKLSSCTFPGTGHNEAAWRARLEVPLAFLLEGKTPRTAPGRVCELFR